VLLLHLQNDDVHTVEEFVDKYNLDKDLLKNLLEERRHNIDSLLSRLDKVKSQSVMEGPYEIRPVGSQQEKRPEWGVRLVGQEPIEVHLGIKETIKIAQKALKDGFKHFTVKIDPLTCKVIEMSLPPKIKSTKQEQLT
jgi:hypothetical protein